MALAVATGDSGRRDVPRFVALRASSRMSSTRSKRSGVHGSGAARRNSSDARAGRSSRRRPAALRATPPQLFGVSAGGPGRGRESDPRPGAGRRPVGGRSSRRRSSRRSSRAGGRPRPPGAGRPVGRPVLWRPLLGRPLLGRWGRSSVRSVRLPGRRGAPEAGRRGRSLPLPLLVRSVRGRPGRPRPPPPPLDGRSLRPLRSGRSRSSGRRRAPAPPFGAGFPPRAGAGFPPRAGAGRPVPPVRPFGGGPGRPAPRPPGPGRPLAGGPGRPAPRRERSPGFGRLAGIGGATLAVIARRAKTSKGPANCRAFRSEKSAATYSPRGSLPKYHRRRRA